MTDDLLTRDLIQYDPLSTTTRKERTSLLGLSMLGLALVKVPLVPEKFSALGIEFTQVNQAAFVKIYSAIVVYYIFAFAIYATTDYVAWRRQEVINAFEYDYRRNARSNPGKDRVNLDELLGKPKSDSIPHPTGKFPSYTGAASYFLAKGTARVRAFFEFLLPIGFASYSLYELYRYAYPA